MIIFFYGQDTYRMRQKLKALKEKFISASLGNTNLSVLDGANISYDEFVRQILAMPFLSKSRLVIVENIMKGQKSAKGGPPPKADGPRAQAPGRDILEKIPEALSKVPNSTILVLVEEGKPDKRTSIFKKLAKEKVEEFKLLEPDQLRRWIIREVENRKSKIDSDGLSKLIEYVGNDLWRMSNELDKLTAYFSTSLGTGSKQLTAENIELLVNPQIQANVFDLIDNIARKNLSAAIKELYKMLNTGQHELYILTMISWQYRNLLIIKDLALRTKISNSWALAKKAGISPYVVQKCLSILPRYKFEELKKIYAEISDYDFKIKTGKIKPRPAIELLIFRLCKN